MASKSTYNTANSAPAARTSSGTNITQEVLGNFEVSHPSRKDVILVRDMLLRFVPAELVHLIMNEAMYWAGIITSRKEEIVVRASDNANNSADQCYLLSVPIPKAMRDGEIVPTKVKMVKFMMRSCDQGKGGCSLSRGTYNSSWTWFDAAIFRPARLGTAYTLEEVTIAPGIAKRWEIQRNVHASRSRRLHEVIWAPDSKSKGKICDGKGAGTGFIETLRAGDCIGIMVRALYPSWENHVSFASIEILYQV